MTGQAQTVQQGVDRRGNRNSANARSDGKRAKQPISIPPAYCSVCNLILGSQERRVLRGGKVAHPGCVGRARKSEAA